MQRQAILGSIGVVLWFGAVVYVFFGFGALPFMDLPAHAGLIALRHRYAQSPFDQANFLVVPRVGPYSLFRFLGEALTARIGPLYAVRVLAFLPAVLTPLAVAWARWRLHRDWHPGLPAMAAALSFGLMTAFGFASYLLGLTTLIVAFTLWLELLGAHERNAREIAGRSPAGGKRPILRTAVALACLSPLVFLGHGHAFLLLLVLSSASWFAPPWRARRFAWIAVYVPAISVAGYSAYSEKVLSLSVTSLVSCPNTGMHFQGLVDKLSLLLTPTLITRTGLDVLVGLTVWALVSVASARTVRAAWRGATIADFQTRALSLGVVALAIGFAILPHTISWFGFVDGRLVLPVLLFALIGIRSDCLPARLTKIVERAGVAACALQVVLVLVASSYFQREASGYADVLARVPAGARLLDLPIDPDSRVFTGHPFVHYGMLALVNQPMLASDIWYHQGTAVYPRAGNPALRLPATYCESDMKSVDWGSLRLDDWDYVLMRQSPLAVAPATPPALILVSHEGGWWLWRTGSRRVGPT